MIGRLRSDVLRASVAAAVPIVGALALATGMTQLDGESVAGDGAPTVGRLAVAAPESGAPRVRVGDAFRAPRASAGPGGSGGGSASSGGRDRSPSPRSGSRRSGGEGTRGTDGLTATGSGVRAPAAPDVPSAGAPASPSGGATGTGSGTTGTGSGSAATPTTPAGTTPVAAARARLRVVSLDTTDATSDEDGTGGTVAMRLGITRAASDVEQRVDLRIALDPEARAAAEAGGALQARVDLVDAGTTTDATHPALRVRLRLRVVGATADDPDAPVVTDAGSAAADGASNAVDLVAPLSSGDRGPGPSDPAPAPDPAPVEVRVDVPAAGSGDSASPATGVVVPDGTGTGEDGTPSAGIGAEVTVGDAGTATAPPAGAPVVPPADAPADPDAAGASGAGSSSDAAAPDAGSAAAASDTP